MKTKIIMTLEWDGDGELAKITLAAAFKELSETLALSVEKKDEE